MDARELLVKADGIAREMGLTQAEWCRRAGYDIYGKRISRAYARGDCKLTTLATLLRPLGYELVIKKQEE